MDSWGWLRRHFNGIIDDVRVYNPDLTKAQIAELQKALPKCRISHNAKK